MRFAASMKVKRIIITGLFVVFLTAVANAQTPVADRVRAAIKHLPTSIEVVAKYTDNARHCLYYILDHRLYCLDVIRNKNKEVDFPESYLKILDYYLVHAGKLLFVSIDRGSLSKTYAVDGQKLYMIDPLTRRIKEVGSGYSIKRSTLKNNECFSVKKAHKCLNPNEIMGRQQWIAREHFFGIDGSVLYAGKEFKIRIAPK